MKDGVRLWFGDRILDIDEEFLLIWRRMVHDGQKAGYTYAQPDALIAATAKAHDLGVAARNVGDFRNAGIPVFDPWTNRLSTTCNSTAKTWRKRGLSPHKFLDPASPVAHFFGGFQHGEFGWPRKN